jgi:CPA2 family monovalent cation:H+ antiporter-2
MPVETAASSVAIPVIEVGVILLAALVLGLAANALRLASSVGYILAGLLLGPLAFGYLVPGSGVAPFFGEIGILMLMFYLGLELSIREFRKTSAVALVLVACEFLVFSVLGFALARAFGFNSAEAAVVGVLLPYASTAIVVKFILDNKLIETVEARTAVSALVIEDFVSILVLVAITGFAAQKSGAAAPVGFGSIVLNGLLFTIAAFFVVSRASRVVLEWLERHGHADKMAAYAVGAGLLVAYAGSFIGLTSILGAYFAGFALAETHYGKRIKRELGFFREFFLMFFFVSFGTTVSFAGAASVLPLLAVILVFYFFLKILVYGAVGSALGLGTRSAVAVGTLMTSIGEFSIIIASAGAALAATAQRGQEITALAFLLCITTCLFGPLFYARRERIAALFARLYPAHARDFLHSLACAAGAAGEAEERVFRVGYGRVLRNIAVNFVVALAIVYVSGLAAASTADFPLLGKISLGVIASLFVVWPLFRILVELKNLVHGIIAHALRCGSPYARISGIPRAAANAFTGLVLAAFGFGVTALAFFEHANNFLILAPALYTLLALAFLATSLYSLSRKLKYAGGMQATSLAPATPATTLAAGRILEREHTRRALATYFTRNPPKLKFAGLAGFKQNRRRQTI